MKTETLHKLIESNLEWLYQQMGKYYVDEPQDMVHDIITKILAKEDLYAKAPEDLPVAEFRKWFSAYIYWQFRSGQRQAAFRLSHEIPFSSFEGEIPAFGQDNTEQIELGRDLQTAFKEFSEPFRSQLRSVLQGDMTVEELAKELGVPFKTAETRVFRARKKLQQFLSAYSTNSEKGVKENSTNFSYTGTGRNKRSA